MKVNAAIGQCWVNVKFWGGVIPGKNKDFENQRNRWFLHCQFFRQHSKFERNGSAWSSRIQVFSNSLRCVLLLICQNKIHSNPRVWIKGDAFDSPTFVWLPNQIYFLAHQWLFAYVALQIRIHIHKWVSCSSAFWSKIRHQVREK